MERGAARLLKQDDALAANLRGVLAEPRAMRQALAMAEAARTLANPTPQIA